MISRVEETKGREIHVIVLVILQIETIDILEGKDQRSAVIQCRRFSGFLPELSEHSGNWN